MKLIAGRYDVISLVILDSIYRFVELMYIPVAE